jgi:hypothetical protein
MTNPPIPEQALCEQRACEAGEKGRAALMRFQSTQSLNDLDEAFFFQIERRFELRKLERLTQRGQAQ